MKWSWWGKACVCVCMCVYAGAGYVGTGNIRYILNILSHNIDWSPVRPHIQGVDTHKCSAMGEAEHV